MALNFSTLVYLPTFDLYARPITVNPVGSQPGQPPYSIRTDDPGSPSRGIYNTIASDVIGEDGMIFTDHRTELDVRDVEYSVVPDQFDIITIGPDGELPDLGDWEVKASHHDAEGCTTLTLMRVVP